MDAPDIRALVAQMLAQQDAMKHRKVAGGKTVEKTTMGTRGNPRNTLQATAQKIRNTPQNREIAAGLRSAPSHQVASNTKARLRGTRRQ